MFPHPMFLFAEVVCCRVTLCRSEGWVVLHVDTEVFCARKPMLSFTEISFNTNLSLALKTRQLLL